MSTPVPETRPVQAEPSPSPPTPGSRAVDLLLVVALTLVVGWATATALILLPMWAGSVPLPISAVLIAWIVSAASRLCYRLTARMGAAVAPVAAWFVVTIALTLVGNALYPQLPVVVRDWRLMLFFAAGALAGAAALGLLWGDHLRDRIQRTPGAEPIGGAAATVRAV